MSRRSSPDFVEALARGLDIIRAFSPTATALSVSDAAARAGAAAADSSPAPADARAARVRPVQPGHVHVDVEGPRTGSSSSGTAVAGPPRGCQSDGSPPRRLPLPSTENHRRWWWDEQRHPREAPTVGLAGNGMLVDGEQQPRCFSSRWRSVDRRRQADIAVQRQDADDLHGVQRGSGDNDLDLPRTWRGVHPQPRQHRHGSRRRRGHRPQHPRRLRHGDGQRSVGYRVVEFAQRPRRCPRRHRRRRPADTVIVNGTNGADDIGIVDAGPRLRCPGWRPWSTSPTPRAATTTSLSMRSVAAMTFGATTLPAGVIKLTSRWRRR